MEIGSIDKEILEKISGTMNYTGPLLIRKRAEDYPNFQDLYKLSICNSKICEDLTKLDCPPNKTFITKFPTEDKVPKNLLRHYLRGLLDSDGSIYQTKQQGAWHVCIADTFNLLNGLCDFVEVELRFRPKLYKHKTIYIARMNCSFAKRFLDYIYQAATIYMERKYKLYQEILKST